jgi:hypothetical protein
MKKKIGAVLALTCLGAACVLAGCGAKNKLDRYKQQGYTVMVTYDANGGSFTGRTGVTLIDLFNPSKFEADENKEVHIPLLEPTDPSRTVAGAEVSLTMSGCFFAGWYQNREVVKNEQNKPVDINGTELTEKDGNYYYVGTEKLATPAYKYDGYWDFKEDTIDYSIENDKSFEMTLYAGWLPNYSFEYYHQNPLTQEWELLDTTTFDYKETNLEGSKTHDWDTIQLPDWKDGVMNYDYRYENQKTYNFPKVEGRMFVSAYTDAECTQEITEKTFEHGGSLDYETCTPINPVQKIYIKTMEGDNYYRIQKASEFSKIADATGIYEIMADLDFTGVKWPTVFGSATFTGSIRATEGNTFKMSNITATHSSTGTVGGLFARIGKQAVIENITFENTTLNLNNVPVKKSEAYYGLFAGWIEDGAKISGVTVGGAIRLGALSAWSENYDLHLCANGNTAGITRTAVKIYVYGTYLWAEEVYEYAIDADSVSVAEEYVSMSVVPNIQAGTKAEEEYYIGEY